jgi:hypothetical protein
MTNDIEEFADYIAERGEGMVRCKCGLAIANDKMRRHLESEHFVKMISDAYEAVKSRPCKWCGSTDKYHFESCRKSNWSLL